VGRRKSYIGNLSDHWVLYFIGVRRRKTLEILQEQIQHHFMRERLMAIKLTNVTGNTGSMTAKNANIKSSGPMIDSPKNCGNLDAYGLYIRSIHTNLDHFGEHTEIAIVMELGSFNLHDNPASKNIQNFETFLKDVYILNKIKKAKHPGVIEQWEKMQVLLELTTKKDK